MDKLQIITLILRPYALGLNQKCYIFETSFTDKSLYTRGLLS